MLDASRMTYTSIAQDVPGFLPCSVCPLAGFLRYSQVITNNLKETTRQKASEKILFSFIRESRQEDYFYLLYYSYA